MDIIILASGLATRLNKFTHDIIPKYLINLDDNTGLYYIIKYWNNYASNIYLVINSKFNVLTQFYINNMLNEYTHKIIIINYDSNDGTAYTLNYILNNQLKDKNIKNLLLTWCDLYPLEKINFNIFENIYNISKNKNNNIYIFTNGDKCRYLLDNKNNIKKSNDCKGNIIGIYYFQNYKPFNLDDNCKYNDIVDYLENIGEIFNYRLKHIVDYGDEEKYLKIIDNNYNIESKLRCRYFNEISILENNKLIKKGINTKGKEIIKYEKNWYKHINNIKNNDIKNIIPQLYDTFEYGILIEYKKKHIPIYDFFLNYEKNILNISDENKKIIKKREYDFNKIIVLKNILNKINILHNLEIKEESKTNFFTNLKKEIYDKLYERKNKINDFINYFGNITVVNNIKIDTFDNIVNKCKKIITEYYKSLQKYNYSIIFGDCQFSNILINQDNTDDIIFIDPRGYFGNSMIYGPIEYDYAKILYGISGYDSFNLKYFNIKKIDNDSIEFEINKFYYEKKIIDKYFNHIHKAFLIIIWLGLAEYNKNNIWKCLASYYHGLYLGTIMLE
jgi:hypothetical protein